eukprot:1208866-Prorocentrum_lima.AAC.1
MAAALLESTWKPVRTYPVVTEWVQTFALTAAKPRHKVLVVNGPTCLGKTVWARQSFGPAREVYEVNACNMVSPDMR